MNRIISDSPAHSTGTDALWEKPTLELDFVSTEQITLEWIQSLSPELKDAALFRFCKTVEAKPTMVESFTLNQVFYRTISGGTFTESAENVAARTGCDRKTVLKGLHIAVEQNILEKNERPGTSTEYSFKPVEEWQPEPPVRNKDIRNNKIIELPSSQECTEAQSDEESGVVQITDDHIMDTNTVVVNELLELSTEEVSVPESDTPKSSHWKYVGQGLPRVYMPPELDQETGKKIESIHSATKEPRQFIIKHAVELLYDSLNRIPSVAVEKPIVMTQAAAAVTINPVVIPVAPTHPSSDAPTDEELTDAIRELRRLKIEDNATVRAMIKRLWCNFQGAYESIKLRIERREPFVNITGAFVNALKNGDKPACAVVVEQVLVPTHGVDEPSAEEMALIDDALANGRAKEKYCGSLGWLVIENNGHTAPWRQFLTLLLQGHR